MEEFLVNMKKLFALLLALAMVFSMGLGAVAEETAEEAIPELAEPVAGGAPLAPCPRAGIRTPIRRRMTA